MNALGPGNDGIYLALGAFGEGKFEANIFFIDF